MPTLSNTQPQVGAHSSGKGPQEALLTDAKNIAIKLHSKKAAYGGCLFGEGISFLWGVAKLYIMYWGVLQLVL